MYLVYSVLFFFFFKQKTAYEMRISDWSSDVCSSDLPVVLRIARQHRVGARDQRGPRRFVLAAQVPQHRAGGQVHLHQLVGQVGVVAGTQVVLDDRGLGALAQFDQVARSEEHTSELQSLMRISYAVFCFKKKKTHK